MPRIGLAFAAALAALALGACGGGGGGTTPTAGGMTPTPAPAPTPTPTPTPAPTLGGPSFYERFEYPSGVYHTEINCRGTGHALGRGECFPLDSQGQPDFPRFTTLSRENVEKIKSGNLLYQYRDYTEPDGTGELAASAPNNFTEWEVTRTYAALDGHWQAVTDSNFRGRAAAAGMDLQTALIQGNAGNSGTAYADQHYVNIAYQGLMKYSMVFLHSDFFDRNNGGEQYGGAVKAFSIGYFSNTTDPPIGATWTGVAVGFELPESQNTFRNPAGRNGQHGLQYVWNENSLREWTGLRLTEPLAQHARKHFLTADVEISFMGLEGRLGDIRMTFDNWQGGTAYKKVLGIGEGDQSAAYPKAVIEGTSTPQPTWGRGETLGTAIIAASQFTEDSKNNGWRIPGGNRDWGSGIGGNSFLEGNFYGPNHEEAGGTFAFHFRPPTTFAEDRTALREITMGIIGVFGAKKQP